MAMVSHEHVLESKRALEIRKLDIGYQVITCKTDFMLTLFNK